MALKRKKVVDKNLPFEETAEIKKLSLFVTIINYGQANSIIALMEKFGANAQYVETGSGTAEKEVLDLLGINDNSKEIIFSLVKDEKIEDIKKELEAYFMMAKRNRGVGFAIPFTSLIGVKVYQFLANSIKE